MTDRPTRLFWRFAEGRGDRPAGNPDDLGHAWIERPDGTERRVNDGVRITRSEARWLAGEYGYELSEEG